MYGTIARLQLKPGAERQLVEVLQDFDQKKVNGFVTSYLYRTDSDLGAYYLAVVFDSREAYLANAESPEQHQRYLRMLDLLNGSPTWHDGQIVYGASH